MSSANRKPGVRHKDDLYSTPNWCTEAILLPLTRRIKSLEPLVYEPACGNGAMVAVLKDYFGRDNVHASDINGNPSVDFLTAIPEPKYDLIITNPPYKLAMQFIEQAFKWRKNENSVVAMLLRLNFLGSRKRAKWFRDHMPHVYVSPARPSFTYDGHTDSTEYMWAVWQEPFQQSGSLHILPTEGVKAPKKHKIPLHVEQGSSWADLIGSWPGEESDEEVFAALEDD